MEKMILKLEQAIMKPGLIHKALSKTFSQLHFFVLFLLFCLFVFDVIVSLFGGDNIFSTFVFL